MFFARDKKLPLRRTLHIYVYRIIPHHINRNHFFLSKELLSKRQFLETIMNDRRQIEDPGRQCQRLSSCCAPALGRSSATSSAPGELKGAEGDSFFVKEVWSGSASATRQWENIPWFGHDLFSKERG